MNESACRYGSRLVLLRYRSSAWLLCRTSIVKATLIEASRARPSLASNHASARIVHRKLFSFDLRPSLDATSALTLVSRSTIDIYTFPPRPNDTLDRSSALGGNDRRRGIARRKKARIAWKERNVEEIGRVREVRVGLGFEVGGPVPRVQLIKPWVALGRPSCFHRAGRA